MTSRKDGGFRSDSKVGKCFDELVNLYNQGISTIELGERFNIDASNIFRGLKSRGIAIRSKSEAGINSFATGKSKALSGPECRFWKGGRQRHTNGYILLLNPSHYRANSNGYVPEHIVVAENKYERRLKNNEVVHHVNRIRDDNRPENLVIMTTREHQQLHGMEGAIKKWYGK
jgi:hypothetical protein